LCGAARPKAIEPLPPAAAFAATIVGMRKRKSGLTPRKSKITVPERCDPRAKVVFAEMKRQAVTYDELEWESGVLRSTFKAWRTNNKPGLDTLEAALGALGWALLPVPNLDRINPHVREDLEAIAERYGLETIPHRELVAACVRFRPARPHMAAISLRRAA